MILKFIDEEISLDKGEDKYFINSDYVKGIEDENKEEVILPFEYKDYYLFKYLYVEYENILDYLNFWYFLGNNKIIYLVYHRIFYDTPKDIFIKLLKESEFNSDIHFFLTNCPHVLKDNYVLNKENINNKIFLDYILFILKRYPCKILKNILFLIRDENLIKEIFINIDFDKEEDIIILNNSSPEIIKYLYINNEINFTDKFSGFEATVTKMICKKLVNKLTDILYYLSSQNDVIMQKHNNVYRMVLKCIVKYDDVPLFKFLYDDLKLKENTYKTLRDKIFTLIARNNCLNIYSSFKNEITNSDIDKDLIFKLDILELKR